MHVSIFPSYDPSTNSLAPIRTPLQFSLLLSSTLDVFELRARGSGGVGVGGGGSATGAAATTAAQLSGDLGLLHAVDDRLAAYGAETNTGVKFVAVVDMRGRLPGGGLLSPSSSGPAVDKDRSKGAAAVGLREGEMKPVGIPLFREDGEHGECLKYIHRMLTHLRKYPGVQSDADGIHQAATEPFLRSR